MRKTTISAALIVLCSVVFMLTACDQLLEKLIAQFALDAPYPDASEVDQHVYA